MSDALRAVIGAFLETQSTLALATVNAAGLPESAPVYYVSDDQLNLYWLSSANVRHSVNLTAQARVSGAVYPAVWQWNEISGVQIEGEAAMIKDDRIREQILLLYLRKFALPPAFDAAIASSGLYVLRPRWMRWVDNSVEFGYKAELSFDV